MAGAPFAQLVVVGSPAGDDETLSGLVSGLPEDFPAPVVMPQHPAPDGESLLEKQSALPVRTVSEKVPLEAGGVFVVPPNRHVEIVMRGLPGSL